MLSSSSSSIENVAVSPTSNIDLSEVNKMYSGPLLDGGDVGVVSSEVEEQLDRNTIILKNNSFFKLIVIVVLGIKFINRNQMY